MPAAPTTNLRVEIPVTYIKEFGMCRLRGNCHHDVRGR